MEAIDNENCKDGDDGGLIKVDKEALLPRETSSSFWNSFIIGLVIGIEFEFAWGLKRFLRPKALLEAIARSFKEKSSTRRSEVIRKINLKT